MSNSDTEKKAFELVKKFLIATKRVKNESEITRAKKGSGYDFDLADGSKIEIKASKQSKFNFGLRLNSKEEINFFVKGGEVFRVLDVFKEPKLYIVKGGENYISRKKWATCSVPLDQQGDSIDL